MAPTYRRCRLIKSLKHLIRRELRIDPAFAVIKDVSFDELTNDFTGTFLRVLAEEKEEGVAPDATVTRNMTFTIDGKVGTWDMWGFCRNTNVYLVDSHDSSVIFKAD